MIGRGGGLPKGGDRRALPLLLAVAIAGCTSEAREGGAAKEGPPAATVRLGRAGSGAIFATWRLLGEVRAKARARLAAGEPGEVRRVTVREGDAVAKGRLLVAIDPALARSGISAAEAQLEQVRAMHAQAAREAARLSRAGPQTVSMSQIDAAQARVSELVARKAELEATIGQARERLARHRVVAPFAGQVAARLVDPGDWVQAGTPVVELVAVSETEVLARAPLELVDHLASGKEASLRRGDHEVAAEVVGLVRALDAATRTITVRLVPKGDAPWLLPGSTVDTLFRIRTEADGAVVVPRDALVVGVTDTRVVKAVGGRARPVRIEVLGRSESEALVRGEGLVADDKVVVRGNERLRPEQPLKVIEK